MMDAGVRVRTIVSRGGVVIADIPYTLALTLSQYFSPFPSFQTDIIVLHEYKAEVIPSKHNNTTSIVILIAVCLVSQ